MAQITNVLGQAGVNIANLVNGSRGDYAYTLIALDAPTSSAVADEIAAIEDVVRIRVIKWHLHKN